MDAAPLVASVRRLLLVAALLVFLAGVQLFVFPLRTDTYFAWTIASPMTAVFLGASYWSAVGLEMAAAREQLGGGPHRHTRGVRLHGSRSSSPWSTWICSTWRRAPCAPAS